MAGAMKSFGWLDALWGLGIGAAATAAYFFFRTPEPARTGLELIALVCERSPERAQAVARFVADPLALVLPEEEAGGERTLSHTDIGAELERLDTFSRGCAFSLQDWSLRSGSGGTWLEGTLEYSDSQPSDLHGQRRPLRALFRANGEGHRLSRVVLGPLERRLPEARP
jgi:hypothetical protein